MRKTTRIFIAIMYIGTAVFCAGCDMVNTMRDNTDDPKNSGYVQPPDGTFRIGNGVATNSLSVALYMNMPGATEMRFGNTVNERNSSDWEVYADTMAFELVPGTEGGRTVYGAFRNSIGEEKKAEATVTYDVTPPTDGSIVINSDDLYTTSYNVILTVSANDDVAMGSMCFSNDGTSWSDCQDYAESADWVLEEGEGEKTVYVKFTDMAGNEFSTVLNDTITYLAVFSSEITVKHDSTDIVSGSGSLTFGSTLPGYAQDREFAVYNTGTGDLSLGTVSVSGDSAFSVISQPDSSVESGSSALFTLCFNPGSPGEYSATVTIPNNDSDKNPYTFVVNGVCYENGAGVYSLTRRFGGTGNEYEASITTDSSGNMYVVGCFDGTVDFASNFGSSDSKTSSGQLDIFVTRINSDGSYGWTRRIGGGSYDYGYSITIDGSGNVYVTGCFSGIVDFASDFGSADSKTSTGSYDVFITKINNDGSYVWTRQMGDTSYDSGKSISSDSSGNVYVTGCFSGIVDFASDFGSADSKTSAGDDDIFVTKINSDGSYVWTRRMGGTGSDCGNSITTDSSGNVYVTGTYNDTVNFMSDFSGTDNRTSVGGCDVFVTRLNNNGSYEWTRCISGSDDDGESSMSIISDSTGNVYITGNFRGTVNFASDFSGTDSIESFEYSFDVFVTKIISNGSYGWTRRIGGTGDDFSSSITSDSDCNVYVTGQFGGTVNFASDFGGSDNKTSLSGGDVFVTRLNSDCSYGWTRRIGGTGYDYGKSISCDSSGNLYLAGYFSDTVDFAEDFYMTDSKTSAGGSDIFITQIK